MKRLFLLSAALLLSSCGLLRQPFRHQKEDGSSTELVINKSNDPNAPLTASLRLPGAQPQPGAAANTAAPFANPQNAAQANPLLDFSSLFSGGSARPQMTNWRRSASDAITEARRTGHPLVILFTSQFSQPAVQMETLLGNLPELANAAEQRFVPLRIDFSDKTTLESEFYRALKTRYNPHGFPVLVGVMPDGTELTRQTGYSDEWKSRTAQWIKSVPERAQSATSARRKRLEQSGYRAWSDRSGTPVFAKLENVDANQLTFTGEWGEQFRTFINRLSDADQQRLMKKS